MQKKSLLLLSLLASFSAQQNILHAGESEGELTTINESNKKAVFKYVSPESILFETVAIVAAIIQYLMDKFWFEKTIAKTDGLTSKKLYGGKQYKIILTLACLLLGFGVAMVARKLLYCEESNKHTFIRGVILTVLAGLAMVIVIEFGPLSNLFKYNYNRSRAFDIVQLQLVNKMVKKRIVKRIVSFQIFSGLLVIISGFVFSKIPRFVLPSKFDIEKTEDVVSSLSKDNLV